MAKLTRREYKTLTLNGVKLYDNAMLLQKQILTEHLQTRDTLAGCELKLYEVSTKFATVDMELSPEAIYVEDVRGMWWW